MIDNLPDFSNLELSEAEMAEVEKILKELATRGSSDTYKQLLYPHYEEIPVSIGEFIRNPDLLGNSCTTEGGEPGSAMYPYWRDVISLVMHGGKSYKEVILAGCVEGSTRIPLLDGTNPTILELYNRWTNGERSFWVYSYDHQTNRIIPGKVSNVFCAGFVPTYEITFDDGSKTRCSWDHQFLMRDGHYKYAKDLVPDDSIMPFNRYESYKGYEVVRHPLKDGTYKDEKTYRMSYNFKRGSRKGAIHHKNFKKYDNRPENLVRIPGRVHYMYHARHGGDKLKEFNKNHPEVLRERFKLASEIRWSDPSQRVAAAERISKMNSNPEIIARQISSRVASGNIEDKRLARIQYNKTQAPRIKRILENYTNDQILDALHTSYNLEDAARKLGMSIQGVRGCMRRLGVDSSELMPLAEINNSMHRRYLKYYNRVLKKYGTLNDELVKKEGYYRVPRVDKFIKELFNDDIERFLSVVSNYNHKVVSVRLIEDPILVYDLTVNNYHNFAMIPAADGNKDSCIFCHNGIGLGKSWVACVMACYLLYRLLCLRNPQSYYKLAPNEPIVFAFFNIHKYVSLDVAYGKFQRMLQNSPWFLRHGQIRGSKNPEYYPNKGIEFTVGYNNDAAIGKNIFVALLDEMSFAKHANADMMKSGIMDLYRSVDARMVSRFTIGGVCHAKKFLISSKKSDSDFLDQYAQSQVGNPETFIVDEPQWVVKPEGTFSKKTFRLAVGSKTKKSMILADDDPRTDSQLLESGYTQIIHPPESLKPKFEFDMDASLRDLAGVSTTIFTKFISYDKLSKCYSKKFKNAFTNSTPIIGLNDDYQLWDFFDLELVPDWVKELPGFIHLDIAYSGDGYGIGYVASAGMKTQFKPHIGEQQTDPIYINVFAASIKANKGDQVSLEKVRQFIYWLKFTQGFNLRSVSADGFMSADTLQAMSTRGIEAKLISLDKKPDGYLAFKNAIYEKRTTIVEDDLLETELLNLERNEMTGKIDHPLNGCFSGDTKIIMTPKHYGVREDISFEELTNNYEKYKDWLVVGCTEDGRTKLCKFKSPRITKYVDEILEIELDNGEVIKCTPDHRFMLRDGSYKMAKDLSEEDDIMESLSKDSINQLASDGISKRKIAHLIKDIIIGMYRSGLARWKIREELGISTSIIGEIVGKSEAYRNKSEAQKLAINHGNAGAVTMVKNDPEYRDKVIRIAKEKINKLHQDPEYRNKMSKMLSERNITPEMRERMREIKIRDWNNPEYRKKMELSGNSKYGHHQEYYSKYGRMYLKSNVERLFVEYCESNTEIIDLEYEKVSLSYEFDGKNRVYIPDFLVTYSDGTQELVEVKLKEPSPQTEKDKAKYIAAKNSGYIYKWYNRAAIRNLIEEVAV